MMDWEDIGLPSFLVPAPPPFLPIPRGLVMRMEDLDEWEAYVLHGSSMESLGTVYGEDEDEAIEAAENLARVRGNGFSAVKVERQ